MKDEKVEFKNHDVLFYTGALGFFLFSQVYPTFFRFIFKNMYAPSLIISANDAPSDHSKSTKCLSSTPSKKRKRVSSVCKKHTPTVSLSPQKKAISKKKNKKLALLIDSDHDHSNDVGWCGAEELPQPSEEDPINQPSIKKVSKKKYVRKNNKKQSLTSPQKLYESQCEEEEKIAKHAGRLGKDHSCIKIFRSPLTIPYMKFCGQTPCIYVPDIDTPRPSSSVFVKSNERYVE